MSISILSPVSSARSTSARSLIEVGVDTSLGAVTIAVGSVESESRRANIIANTSTNVGIGASNLRGSALKVANTIARRVSDLISDRASSSRAIASTSCGIGDGSSVVANCCGARARAVSVVSNLRRGASISTVTVASVRIDSLSIAVNVSRASAAAVSCGDLDSRACYSGTIASALVVRGDNVLSIVCASRRASSSDSSEEKSN